MEKIFVNQFIGKDSNFNAFTKFDGQLKPLNSLSDFYRNTVVGYNSIDANGLVLQMNDTELEWLGYSREEVIGVKNIRELLSLNSLAFFLKTFPDIIEQGFGKEIRVELLTKKGKTFPVIVNMMCIYDEVKNFVMARCTIIPIVEQKRLELELISKNQELLHLNESLFALNQEKNRFLGIASHDLQTPLTNLRLLAEKFNFTQQNLTERQKFWVNDIQETIDNMTGMIRSLLDVGRIEQGANMPTFEQVDLVDLVPKILGRFQNLADRKQIAIRLNCPDNQSFIQTDPSYLIEILENLLSNAVKFSPIGGIVEVEIKQEKGKIQILVKDQGLGIKPEEMPLLFQKFQKLSTRPTAGESSTGLGLSIVKDHAERIEASITCESEYGHGATFVLSF